MHEREITPAPDPARGRALPELVVLAAPADEGLVEAADVKVGALRGHDARSLQVLHDGGGRRPQRRAGEKLLRRHFGKVKREAFEIGEVPPLAHAPQRLRRVALRREHVVVVKDQHLAAGQPRPPAPPPPPPRGGAPGRKLFLVERAPPPAGARPPPAANSDDCRQTATD